MTCLRRGRASDPPGRPTVALKLERTRHAARALPLRHRPVSGRVSGFPRLDYHHQPPGRTRTCDLGGLMPCPKVKCVLARLSRAASGRHARRSPFICCARRIPARRVSPLFVNGLMKSRTNVEPKRSSRRGSNPHAATTSRRTVGARVLRVSRSGTVQFTVQPHAFLFTGSWRRQNADWPKSSLTHAVLVMPTAISPALSDRATCQASAFIAHGSTRFWGDSTHRFVGRASLPFSFTGR